MGAWPPPEPDAVPEELLQLIKPELQPGERLLWASRAGAGSPSPGYRPSLAALTWFFGFAAVSLGCLFVLRLTIDNRRAMSDGSLEVISLVSGVIALFFIVGFLSAFFSRRSERRKLEGQVYALTDRRAVIWVPAERSAVSVHTYQRATIRGEDLHRVQYPDGSGDVAFRNAYMAPSGFLGIAEVRRVEELVRRFLVVPGHGPDSPQESDLD